MNKDSIDSLASLLSQPSPQPHPDPIAWMVGTAFWWTKEEAERDAAETGLPVVGLGAMACTAEVERLRNEHTEAVNVGMRYQDQCNALRAQLAEAQALLRKIGGYNWANVDPEERARTRAELRDMLSASAEPSALPDPLGCNECTHAECGRFDGPRQLECRAMADNACARPGASS